MSGSTSARRRLVTVYGGRVEEMYLYADRVRGLEPVPEPLLERFGRTREIMTLLLTDDRPLARVRAREVLDAIEEKGFFLQMPPPPERPPWAIDPPRTRGEAADRGHREEGS